MKKVFVIAAVAMMLAACQKEEVSNKIISLNASMEQMSGDSKTQLDGLNVVWVEGDEILVFDENKKSAKLKATKGGSETTFTGEAEEGFGTIQYAFYPADKFIETSYNEATIQYQLSNNRTYAVNNIASGENPSYAKVGKGATSAIFKNICGIIKITVDVQGNFFKGLNVKDSYVQMNGTLELTLGDGTSTFVTSGNFQPTYLWNEDVPDLEKGQTYSFYFVTPAATYQNFYCFPNKSDSSVGRLISNKSNTVETSKILQMPTIKWTGFVLEK